jgi:hypothetical protein
MPRLSFSLRDVFWLTMVVGMGVGWWVERGSYRFIIHEYTRWRGAAIYLGSVMERDGWKVDVRDFDGDAMSFDASKDGRTFRIGKHGATEVSAEPVGQSASLSD